MCDANEGLPLDKVGKVAIVYKHRDWADGWLDCFKNWIDESEILRVMINGYDRFMVELRNGTIIQSICQDKIKDGYDLSEYDRVFTEPGIGD